MIQTACNCDDAIRIIPCPVHYLKYWILTRDTVHNKRFKKKHFLFLHENNKPFRCDHLSEWISSLTIDLNTKLNLKMNPIGYARIARSSTLELSVTGREWHN